MRTRKKRRKQEVSGAEEEVEEIKRKSEEGHGQTFRNTEVMSSPTHHTPHTKNFDRNQYEGL